ncbi:MAG: alpha-hydroxy-acid oxidizing protein [Pigmentiphaga sp.]|nr:alpha-hydroxy-acid oxidizing protein [Pigmentiphaga sp.]
MHALTIEDLRQRARRRVPRMFYDYVDAGSWTGATYRDNTDDFGALSFRQRVAIDIEHRSTKTDLLGWPAAMPVAIAPTGLAGMLHADGEIHAARAARDFGIPFTLSTMSVCSIEDVAEATDHHPFWFQLYFMRDRAFMERLLGRAAQAGCSALVLTLDLQVQGQRHQDIRNGLSVPPRLGWRTAWDLVSHPRWCLQMLGTRRHRFGNIHGHVDGVDDLGSLSAWIAQQFDPGLDWSDIAWIKERWPGKLILKGIMTAEDAELAARAGADALIVSNHGGRQLDGALSSIAALPAIVDAVGDRIEIHLDGGVRCGQDVLRALALGCQGVHIGRAMLYGLAAEGEAGVRRALEILHQELQLTMGFCGRTAIGQVDRSILAARHGFEAELPHAGPRGPLGHS